jgi:hypothetical protein
MGLRRGANPVEYFYKPDLGRRPVIQQSFILRDLGVRHD